MCQWCADDAIFNAERRAVSHLITRTISAKEYRPWTKIWHEQKEAREDIYVILLMPLLFSRVIFFAFCISRYLNLVNIMLFKRRSHLLLLKCSSRHLQCSSLLATILLWRRCRSNVYVFTVLTHWESSNETSRCVPWTHRRTMTIVVWWRSICQAMQLSWPLTNTEFADYSHELYLTERMTRIIPNYYSHIIRENIRVLVYVNTLTKSTLHE